MGWYYSYNPRPPRWLKLSGVRLGYRRKVSGWFVLFWWMFLLSWWIFKLIFVAMGWMLYAVVWCWWWTIKDLILLVVWLAKVVYRLVRGRRPVFPRFLPEDDVSESDTF